MWHPQPRPVFEGPHCRHLPMCFLGCGPSQYWELHNSLGELWKHAAYFIVNTTSLVLRIYNNFKFQLLFGLAASYFVHYAKCVFTDHKIPCQKLHSSKHSALSAISGSMHILRRWRQFDAFTKSGAGTNNSVSAASAEDWRNCQKIAREPRLSIHK